MPDSLSDLLPAGSDLDRYRDLHSPVSVRVVVTAPDGQQAEATVTA